eukprot:2041673-Rhodomonas_salina.2
MNALAGPRCCAVCNEMNVHAVPSKRDERMKVLCVPSTRAASAPAHSTACAPRWSPARSWRSQSPQPHSGRSRRSESWVASGPAPAHTPRSGNAFHEHGVLPRHPTPAHVRAGPGTISSGPHDRQARSS